VGDSDRIADPDCGRAFAAAIPGAGYQVLPDTGHLLQLESPKLLLDAVSEFTGTHATNQPG
jgi:pimeloyl-ACP methyl ester carboxylesterase